MTKRGTSNLSSYFIAENPKGGRTHPTRRSPPWPHSPPFLPWMIFFLNAIMIKIWAVIIINSTHFKTTDCYLAYSLGGEKTNIIVETLSFCITAYLNTLLKGIPFLTRAYHMERNRRCKRPSHILAEPGVTYPAAQMFTSTLVSSTSTPPPPSLPQPRCQEFKTSHFLLSLILIRDNHPISFFF